MRRLGSIPRGFSLVELLISMAVFALATASLAGLMIQSSQMNKAQQMRADVQSNATTCLALVLQDLRSAGWDPLNVGIEGVRLPAAQSDSIELFADFNEDGDTDDQDEAVTVRRVADRIEWQRSTGGPWVTLAEHITNDADGDGTPEPMFDADAAVDPTEVGVRITAQSPLPNHRTGKYMRYTAETRVALREGL